MMTRARAVAVATILCFSITSRGADTQVPEGVLPKAADGHELNFAFETGDLKDWTASGDAFKGQPVKGDTVAPRRSDMKSQHQGKYWIGTFEVGQDKPTGTLTSVPFKVTHPFASFLIGGGSKEQTRVELVLASDQKVIFKASGSDTENMARAIVDLQPFQGQEIIIRVVDEDTGGWGHINFD